MSGNLLGKKVIIMNDSFEQSLPIGQYAYVIARIRDTDSVFDYVIRVPKENRQFYVPAQDIELEETVIQTMIQEVEKQASIDYALATGNKELFEQLVGGPKQPEETKSSVDSSKEDFLRKIRLNAYI
ncbi:ATPase [Fodinisporobacter ferrooxydans]|uniref:ATPase n=1 Tax=Fodinisporobacter ferrooxydans TaxID=2901836 RepID=A0ABY4CK36_9BACL|nr:ATPase [Alicyclobacillaceae bacterium MYW30-H2]